jgi:hypothetical protein
MKKLTALYLVCNTMLTLAALATNGTSAGELSWVDGNGRSCDLACRESGSEPVSYGKLNGKKFYVCAANGGNQPGWKRPGFNLQPKWSDHCYVENSGTVMDSIYVCLCHGD